MTEDFIREPQPISKQSLNTKINASTGLKILMCLGFSIGLVLLPENIRTACAQTDSGIQQPQEPTAYSVGDKLQISFYEPLKNLNDSKWNAIGKAQLPGPSYYLHPELSGEYRVQSDWNVTVPMIGVVRAAYRSASELQTALTTSFENLIGHTGYVSVVILERRPIYITGSVKQPGAYKYEPGLTPLALVALAGGERGQEDRWAVVEAVQFAGKEQAFVDRLRRVLAEAAVLRAELNDTAIEVPSKLVDLCGQQQAEALIAAEQARRRPVVQTVADRRKALQLAVDSAQKALSIDTSRLPNLGDGVAVRKNRLASLETLFARGTAHNVQVEQAVGELSDAKDRQAALEAAIQEDERRLASAKIDVAKFEAETKVDLSHELAERQREIDELAPNAAAYGGVVSLLKPQSDSGDRALHFEIVRGKNVFSADITTNLEPGDVLQVKGSSSTQQSAGPASHDSFRRLSESR
jgi:exopolysaccharide production protein ExoF